MNPRQTAVPAPLPNSRPVLALQEWNELHHVAQSTANLWIREGKLPVWVSGGCYLIPADTPRPTGTGKGGELPGCGHLRPVRGAPSHVTVCEWAKRNGVNRRLAWSYAARGVLKDCYESAGLWLIAVNQPCPPPAPRGGASHQRHGRGVGGASLSLPRPRPAPGGSGTPRPPADLTPRRRLARPGRSN